jgi:hypothetical protein
MTKQSSSAFTTHFPSWQRAIEASFNEPDPKKLLERVRAPEAAIFNRLQELTHNPEDASQEGELRAISGACKTLWGLKRDKLGLPDWETK